MHSFPIEVAHALPSPLVNKDPGHHTQTFSILQRREPSLLCLLNVLQQPAIHCLFRRAPRLCIHRSVRACVTSMQPQAKTQQPSTRPRTNARTQISMRVMRAGSARAHAAVVNVHTQGLREERVWSAGLCCFSSNMLPVLQLAA